jgi:superfamily II DNA or RNA helicase
MPFQAREWQRECFERFKQRLSEGATTFVFEACMGAGKSVVAAKFAKHLLNECNVDHVLVLVPWRSIQGDVEKGMLGAFGKIMGLDARTRFFTLARRQAFQPIPGNDATVTLYQEVCNQPAVETLKLWKSKGFHFALICDEIHHTNEINGTWGTYVEQIKDLADYSVFMSGTYFRGDGKPIGCISLDPEGRPIKDYAYTYSTGVRDNVVRAVTTRHLNATVSVYDRKADRQYEIPLNEITSKELSAAKKQVLDPSGECVRHIIETVHDSLMQARQKFRDAACLFVCRPGQADNYTPEGGESIEDKHVHIIAKQIKEITGEVATVVTHRDKDAAGKISSFRKASDPYLVAVNMVSEGCDIPRLRAVAFCRYTTSEMLFRQIVGRALRLQFDDNTGTQFEDGTAAQVYIPTFPLLVEFAERLWTEAQEGIKDRRCKKCGDWPCSCPCEVCGKDPCECEPNLFPEPPSIHGLDATPILDGGHMGQGPVSEGYVQAASQITKKSLEHIHANIVQLGHALQYYDRQIRNLRQAEETRNPTAERERLRRKINRQVRRFAVDVYSKKYDHAYFNEIEKPFREKFMVILNTWPVDRLREIDDRLERRIMEVYRNG